MSNPGDCWRRSWMIGAVGVALIAAVTLGRCASSDSSSAGKSFTAASVQPDSARFAAELPAGVEVLVLRGTVTSQTATALRARAKDLATECALHAVGLEKEKGTLNRHERLGGGTARMAGTG